MLTCLWWNNFTVLRKINQLKIHRSHKKKKLVMRRGIKFKSKKALKMFFKNDIIKINV